MTPPDDDAIVRILAERVDRYRMCPGIVAGIIEAGERRFHAYGRISQATTTQPTANTVFEIGSVTKVFTALLLADMVCRGEVRLEDPVSRFLPAGTTDHGISLHDLASHTAGLPHMQSGFAAARSQGLPDYTIGDLLEEFGRWAPARVPGEQFEYSNFGYAVLGAALSRRAGQDCVQLIQARICQPLGLHDTSAIHPLPHAASRRADGHDESLVYMESARWGWQAFAGSGTVLSTADDLLTLLSACLGIHDTPLAPALALMVRDLRRTDAFYIPNTPMPGNHVGLGWMVRRDGQGDIIWHGGGVNGFRAFLGYAPGSRRGVAVLSNAFAGPQGVDDIGFHLLDATLPLAPMREEALAPAAMLEGLAGRYLAAGGPSLSVCREGERLFILAPGGYRARLFFEAPDVWFVKTVDGQVRFSRDASGRPASLLWEHAGVRVRLDRIADEPGSTFHNACAGA